MIAQRIQPPLKGQTLADSCWAACLDAWSKADGRFGGFLSEMDLVGQYGQTLTGGITPADIFPKFGDRWRMWSNAYGSGLYEHLVNLMKDAHVMMSYRMGPGQWHAVLVYKITDYGKVHAMNPAKGGRWMAEGIDFFEQRSPVAFLTFK